jgi:uridine kinase
VSGRSEVVAHVADTLVGIPTSHPLRVAVDGITAAGKTTFARELTLAVQARDRPCMHISMDGFHHRRAVRYRRGRESADGYYEDAYDVAALRRSLLDPLGPNGDGRYRTAIIDLATDQPIEAPARRAATDLVVIVDGSFLQRDELIGAWDVVVFLRSSFEAASARGAARDAAQLGSVAEAQRIFAVRYHAAHRRYLEEVDPERRADIVIDHDDPVHPRLVRDRQPM